MGGYHNKPYLVSPGPWLKGKDGIPSSALVGRVPAHHVAVRGEGTSTLPAHLTKKSPIKIVKFIACVIHEHSCFNKGATVHVILKVLTNPAKLESPKSGMVEQALINVLKILILMLIFGKEI
jgi:hypothetical protein